MSDQKYNETLEQQRRARKEFLELKKMQHGEMDAGPKPSEVAIVPKTPAEKLKNIWFHDKWLILGCVAVIAVLAVMITQCATRTNYDLEIVAYTYTPIDDARLELAGAYFSQFCEDINGDGEVHIQVINCTFNNQSGDTQYRYTVATKLQAILAADANALLFISDSESYEYLNSLAGEGHSLFEGEPTMLGPEFYSACETESALFPMPEGLMISCRAVDGTTVSSDKHISDYYAQSQNIMKAVQ